MLLTCPCSASLTRRRLLLAALCSPAPCPANTLVSTAPVRFASEDTRQIGEYPVLPLESAQGRDPRIFWDQQDRRNFGEPVHEEDEYLSMWMPDDVQANGRVAPGDQVKQLAFVLGCIALLFGLASLKDTPNTKPVRHVR